MRTRTLGQFVLSIAFGAMATAASFAQAADVGPNLNRLQSIDHGALAGGRVVIRAQFARPLERLPEVFRTYHPKTSIVLDFPSTSVAVSDDQGTLTFRGVHGIRVVQAGHLTRMVIDLNAPVTHEMALNDGDLWLTLTPFYPKQRERESWFLRADAY